MATTNVTSNITMSDDAPSAITTNITTTSDPIHSTTQFLQTGNAKDASFDSTITMDRSLLRDQSVNDFQTIQKFLARPIILRTGTLTEASTGIINIISLHYDLLHNTVYTPKVQGFLNFRATTHITLQVNASRFVQGRLMMYFVPQAQVAGVVALNRSVDLTTKTSCPNVQHDIATDTESTLSIPHVSPKLFYDLTTGNGQVGGVYFSIYCPLQKGSGSSDPTYTIWGHYTDVELEIPTVPGTFLTQAGFSTKRFSKGKSTTDEELASKGSLALTLSGVAAGLSTVANYKIPILSSFLSTPAWVLAKASDLASTFGYSNPTNEALPTPLRNTSLNYQSQSDRGVNSDKLAYFASNKLAPLYTIGGTDMDEGSISYIASRPAFFYNFTMAKTDATGATLYNIDINSNAFRNAAVTINDGVNNLVYRTYTPVGGLMHLFQFWRGGIEITFKMVKTEFHSGRIAVFYNPNPNGSPFTPTLTESNYLLRSIIDLSNTVEFKVVIPYTNNSAWSQDGESEGRLTVRVVNPLQCPDTVPSNIKMYLEVNGASDFQVCCPAPRVGNYLDTPVVVLNGPFVTQSAPVMKAYTLGDGNVNSSIGGQSEHTVGEVVSSIYTLVKRFNRLSLYTTISNPRLRVRPYELNFVGRGWNQNDFAIASATGDLYSIVAGCYAYARGSTGFRIIDSASSNLYTASLAFDDRALRPYYDSPSGFLIHSHSHQTWSSVSENGGIDIEVPHYSELPLRLNMPNSATVDVDYNPPVDDYSNIYYVDIYSTGSIGASTCLLRRSGDDTQFGLFLGFPPLCVSIAPP